MSSLSRNVHCFDLNSPLLRKLNEALGLQRLHRCVQRVQVGKQASLLGVELVDSLLSDGFGL